MDYGISMDEESFATRKGTYTVSNNGISLTINWTGAGSMNFTRQYGSGSGLDPAALKRHARAELKAGPFYFF